MIVKTTSVSLYNLPGFDANSADPIATTAVPFEFSPTLGLLAVGGIFGISRLRKNLAASKTIENLSA